jgi:hypothetical protein
MALVKFLLLSLALLHASFDALPVNALAVQHGHVARGLGHAHADIAKKRDSSKQCRPRPTSAAANIVATTTPLPYSAPSSKPSQTAQSTAPPSTSTPSSSGGGKRLLAWSNNEESSLRHFNGSAVQFIYNWKIAKYSKDDLGVSETAFNNLNFIPTIHDENLIPQIAEFLKPGYATHCFTMNEPDVTGTYIAPEHAAQLWAENIEALSSQGFEIFPPAVTGSPQGLAWLQSFVKSCNGKCSYSRLNLHFYVVELADFTGMLNEFTEAFPGYPVWITEFGCQDFSGAQQPKKCDQNTFETLYKDVMSFVESSAIIEQFAWFGMFTVSEINVDVANAMITCPNDHAGATCTPTEWGTKFINGDID